MKTFVTSDGLTDYVVATTSKPKALAAWGSHQDLFKTGLAHQTDNPELVEAATAKPGEVLRRAAGSRAALAKLKRARKAKAPKAPKPKGPSKAAFRKVAQLEARLAASQQDLARRQTELAGLEKALDEARRALG